MRIISIKPLRNNREAKIIAYQRAVETFASNKTARLEDLYSKTENARICIIMIMLRVTMLNVLTFIL